MANDVIVKKLEYFREELKKHDIILYPKDSSRLTAYFKNQLAAEFGSDIKNANFDDLIASMGGCGISPIENYLDKIDTDAILPVENEEKTQASASHDPASVVEPLTDNLSSTEPEHTQPAEEIKPVKLEKSQKKQKQQFDYQSFFVEEEGVSRKDSPEAREIRRRIAALEKDKKITSRSVSIYRRDFALLSALSQYGKNGRMPLEVDGIDIDNMAQAIHAAVKLLSKELASLGNERLLKYVTDAQSRVTDEVGYIDEKIESLQKKLDKY